VQQQRSRRRRRRRVSRSASWVLQYPRCICKGAAGLLPSCHTNCNPFRYFAVRFGCVLVGLGIALVIGVVLFNNSLQSSRQEFELKCDNIKEVRTANPPMTLEKLKNFDGSQSSLSPSLGRDDGYSRDPKKGLEAWYAFQSKKQKIFDVMHAAMHTVLPACRS
jgi:hypothetical protein